ncbi:hybrid sensor histidine kinase/response regulator [Rubinisphaera margarita]|uniref:hybrid sensor histidine kinase/response regulator n=1 Tax=Rubinisphaera margarita TaxID=2909586 RepID=UPI001EE909C9|nr:hybrid sensor histidine kinase/response regulator [Rubinisphaera margarita]MCG6156252.1 hybrid sensor histidine kinase/response regulator [Rubinisphaera margarita]
MTDPSVPPVHYLMVDDREENLIALEAVLRREELKLIRARSGAEALEAMLEYDFALALIDVQMPEMNGFELAELMRGTERTKRIPIIFLTAAGDDKQRRFQGYETGAVDFLHKPIEPDILKSKAEVFFELYRQREEVSRQRDELKTLLEENSRLLDQTRQYTDALKKADRRKDEFLATLAHELRNPLAPILNAVHLVRWGNLEPSEYVEVHEIVERQVQHMVRLIDDLLDLSRITRDKIELRREVVPLQDVARNAVETSSPLVESNKHQLTVDLPPQPLFVEGDAVRLAQVISNLLNNAAKYTPEGGQIDLLVSSTGHMATVSVRDNGVGIPAEMLVDVFGMFTQVSQHLPRSQGGLGIGLTLVKRLVEMHNGRIEARSEGEGEGTEFIVFLPLASSESADQEQISVGETRGQSSPMNSST